MVDKGYFTHLFYSFISLQTELNMKKLTMAVPKRITDQICQVSRLIGFIVVSLEVRGQIICDCQIGEAGAEIK